MGNTGEKMTTVVNKYCEEYDVNIMRPSKWGNQFIIGRDGTREEVVAKHREWFKKQKNLIACLHEIRGKRLACCCKPGRACHGDNLAYFADFGV